MISLPEDNTRFQLPTRIRTKRTPADSYLVRLTLADRIATLPGIEAVENGSTTLPCSITIHLVTDATASRKQTPPRMLCRLSKDGISVHGLSNRDRHLVLSRGWGSLSADSVLVHLPRDDEELEVCWTILQHAYNSLLNFSDCSRTPEIAAFGELPRFSRTTLQ
ncbi:MAG TPA: hypothetical protein PKK10_15240 [Woeseiaceae bacterium]|nr:hypothetical protein [Woeseiaceae bacterium]